MATRKAGSTAKKTTKKSAASKPSTTTKVTTTTVKAVEAPTATPAAPKSGGVKLGKNVDATFVGALVAEFIGTFLLTATYIVTKGEPLYLGFALIAIVLVLGTVSGAYVNPLLTVGAWVTRRLNTLRAVAYIIAQILGAVAALGILTMFIAGAPQTPTDSQSAMMGAAQTPTLYKITTAGTNKEWYSFFAELIGAVILSLAVATSVRETRDRVAAAFTVGFGLFLAALFAGVAVSYVNANAVVNPAIALTVGAIDWGKINWMSVASFLIAPLIGGVIGFALSDALRVGKTKVEL